MRKTILAAVLVVLLAYFVAYLHTTHGAPFGCWPEPFPPMPAWLQVRYEVYCHA